MKLYVITDGGPDLVQRVREALDAGAEVIVREPVLPDGLPLDRVILHASTPGAVEVAHALHLPSAASVSEHRPRVYGRLGASAHSVAEAHRKRGEGADYVLLSPIFADRHGRPARGTTGLAGFVALGGVTPERVQACHDAGAVGIAVLGGIWQAPDGVTAAVRRYLAALQEIRPQTPDDQ